MDENFGEWLDRERIKRGWSQSELARRGGKISPSAVQQVITGVTHPGPRLCQAVARAFEMPLEEVFRLAEILPPRAKARPIRDSRRVVYEVNTDEVLLQQYHALRPEDQDRIRDMIERLGQIEPRIIGEEEK
jgi:transcriptional regulator with XRE-family HTH domain